MGRAINEAIVLAGGLGTRLRSEIGEYPKPLAPINETPFLTYIFDYLIRQGIQRAILSVGYKWELIRDHYGDNYQNLELIYIIEKEPLGTGGGIRMALDAVNSENCFVVNGDTLFDINLGQLQQAHEASHADCTLALKKLFKVDRYGSVTIEDHKIIGFEEKGYKEECLINGGIYCMNKECLNDFSSGSRFSFESDYLEKDTQQKNICGEIFEDYFIDIGIPEDYYRFAEENK